LAGADPHHEPFHRKAFRQEGQVHVPPDVGPLFGHQAPDPNQAHLEELVEGKEIYNHREQQQETVEKAKAVETTRGLCERGSKCYER